MIYKHKSLLPGDRIAEVCPCTGIKSVLVGKLKLFPRKRGFVGGLSFDMVDQPVNQNWI